ncbi:MAG: hypothetical protein NC432_07460 [Roseburia sp.]|nr:hypothetical protein [Roseburia sp.]MCM1098556.1 hypothetical protein [Ruminococcus flavefaciens]
MAELFAYSENIETVFDLIGDRENDITKSIAWAFVKSPCLLESVVDYLIHVSVNAEDVVIRYQEFEKNKGVTDLEITDNRKFYIIIEAKRGWNLPGEAQLKLYSKRTDFRNSPAKIKAIVSMSECTEEYAKKRRPVIPGIMVLHLPWMEICNISGKLRAKTAGKQNYILNELERYIKRIMTTQKKDTNWVYVVSLGLNKAEIITSKGEKKAADITYVDIVRKYHRYCCPVGGGKGGWPKEPLTYIAFRYNGMLQSIHHIESYTVTDNLHLFVPEIPDAELSTTHFVYELGSAITPPGTVRTGKKIVRSNRVWVQLDTLFTSETVTEAMEISKARMSK